MDTYMCKETETHVYATAYKLFMYYITLHCGLVFFASTKFVLGEVFGRIKLCILQSTKCKISLKETATR